MHQDAWRVRYLNQQQTPEELRVGVVNMQLGSLPLDVIMLLLPFLLNMVLHQHAVLFGPAGAYSVVKCEQRVAMTTAVIFLQKLQNTEHERILQ